MSQDLEHRRTGPIRFWLTSLTATVLIALASSQISGFELPVPRWHSDAPRADPPVSRELPVPVSTVASVAAPLPEETPTATHASAAATVADESAQAQVAWQEATVRPGDSLSALFARFQIPHADLQRIMQLGDATDDLKRLQPGDVVRFRLVDGALAELVHVQDALRSLRVRRSEQGFDAENVVVKPDVVVASSSGTIESSLFESGQKAGLSDAMVMDLANVFGFDIDFVLDLQPGDHFTVVFEELFDKGVRIGDGAILAAEFVNKGKAYRALRYTRADGEVGYYSTDGSSLRRAFIRTPVNFTRISSSFNLARRHPVLNTIRAHKGVDYAAPIGTPVKATGDGRVAFSGVKGGYGNAVILEHAGNYSTVYGHLSRFARGIKQGIRVRQGQVIAYVGKTGLATGPHLHYEFRINGVHHNPVTVALPNAPPIPRGEMDAFRAQTGTAMAQLNVSSARYLASLGAETGPVAASRH